MIRLPQSKYFGSASLTTRVAGLRITEATYDPHALVPQRYNVLGKRFGGGRREISWKSSGQGSLDELQRVWLNDFSFDPRPFAERVHHPVLALFALRRRLCS